MLEIISFLKINYSFEGDKERGDKLEPEMNFNG